MLGGIGPPYPAQCKLTAKGKAPFTLRSKKEPQASCQKHVSGADESAAPIAIAVQASTLEFALCSSALLHFYLQY